MPWKSRHVAGLPDCPWFKFCIIGDLLVEKRITSVTAFAYDIMALYAACLIYMSHSRDVNELECICFKFSLQYEDFIVVFLHMTVDYVYNTDMYVSA